MMHMASFFRNVCLNRENVLKIFTYLWIHSVWNNFVSYPVVFQLIWFSSMLQCLAFTHIEIRHIISGVKWKLLSYKANNVCAFSSMGEIADANAFELLRIWVWFVWYNIRDSPHFVLSSISSNGVFNFHMEAQWWIWNSHFIWRFCQWHAKHLSD